MMNRLLLGGLVCILGLASCGSPLYCNSDVSFDVDNVCIYNANEEMKPKLQKIIDIIDQEWSNKFAFSVQQIKKTYITEEQQASLEFVDSFEDENTLGMTINGFYIKILNNDRVKECIANAPIAHEFLHMLAYKFDMNADHDNAELFLTLDFDKARVSLENILNNRICDEFCEDCWWWRL